MSLTATAGDHGAATVDAPEISREVMSRLVSQVVLMGQQTFEQALQNMHEADRNDYDYYSELEQQEEDDEDDDQ